MDRTKEGVNRIISLKNDEKRLRCSRERAIRDRGIRAGQV